MLGLLGGTFDPIHDGHLSIARTLYQQLDLQEVRLIPCKQPLLGKMAVATAKQRLEMLQLASADQMGLSVDRRELDRATPSYTIETLISFRQEFGDTPLCLILGSDTLAHLNHWHRWQELFQYAHGLIVPRLGLLTTIPPEVNRVIQPKQVTDMGLLHQQAAGLVYTAAIQSPHISATMLRLAIRQGLHPSKALPISVLTYIHQYRLYR